MIVIGSCELADHVDVISSFEVVPPGRVKFHLLQAQLLRTVIHPGDFVVALARHHVNVVAVTEVLPQLRSVLHNLFNSQAHGVVLEQAWEVVDHDVPVE